MMEKGYIKAVVGVDIGADTYISLDGESILDHFDAGTEIWIKMIEGFDRAEIYTEDQEVQYISLSDIIVTLKPEELETLPARSMEVYNSLDEMEIVYKGSYITMSAVLNNFSDEDVYSVKWQYSTDGVEFFDIDGANDLSYSYFIDEENSQYYWKISIVLVSVMDN